MLRVESRWMYTIIVGLGGIGRSLTAIAVNAGDSVVVIDQNEERASDILEHYDVLAIIGNATDNRCSRTRGSTVPMLLSPQRAMTP